MRGRWGVEQRGCRLSQAGRTRTQVGSGRAGRGGEPPAKPLTAHPPADEAAAAKPRATLLERHVLWGELPPGSGCGPFFYIGGSNGASM